VKTRPLSTLKPRVNTDQVFCFLKNAMALPKDHGSGIFTSVVAP
jgi:hypothetical protein